ncbi:MAG: hypothetical protein IKR71_09105 [Bacteroidales bacterium]|jgi:hypothetical protein|nr:hypothetical protein [Bacteroidales bacterium]
MTWLIVIIVVAIIGGIIGWIATDGSADGFKFGALQAGAGCAGVILRIFLWGIAIMAIIALFSWLF